MGGIYPRLQNLGTQRELTSKNCPLLQKVRAPLFCDLQERWTAVSPGLQGAQHLHRGAALHQLRKQNSLSSSIKARKSEELELFCTRTSPDKALLHC